jgi:hypothetical protein
MVSCFIPICETNEQVELKVAGKFQGVGDNLEANPINSLLYQLEYGLLDEIETCESSLLPLVKETNSENHSVSGNVLWKCNNLLART